MEKERTILKHEDSSKETWQTAKKEPLLRGKAKIRNFGLQVRPDKTTKIRMGPVKRKGTKPMYGVRIKKDF